MLLDCARVQQNRKSALSAVLVCTCTAAAAVAVYRSTEGEAVYCCTDIHLYFYLVYYVGGTAAVYCRL